MVSRPSDRPQRIAPDDRRHLVAEDRRAAALRVVTRFHDQPDVARHMLDMLGLLEASAGTLDPGPAPDDRRVIAHRRSR